MKYVVMLLGVALGTLGLSLESVYADFTALMGGTILAAEALKLAVKAEDIWALIISWGTGIALTAIGYYESLGFLAGKEFWQFILIAVGVSFAANGFYTVVRKILEALGVIRTKT